MRYTWIDDFLLDKSFSLVLGGFSKKRQREILENTENEEENSRYPNWLNNEYIPKFINKDKSVCDLAHLVGVNPKNPYSFADLSCSRKKVLEVMKVKVLKSGNHTMGINIYNVSNVTGKKVTGYKITKTVK